MSWGDFIELRMLGTTSHTMNLKTKFNLWKIRYYRYYRTRCSKNLVQCSFSSLSNSLDEHFYNFFLFDSLKAMWNIMECKRDSFSGVLGGARETRWECVSHCLKSMWNTSLPTYPGLNRYRELWRTFFITACTYDPKNSNTWYGHHLRCMCCFFWVVNASRNEKSCSQLLIPTAVFHMLWRGFIGRKFFGQL